MHDPRDLRGIVRDELEQRRTSGHDIADVESDVQRLLGAGFEDVDSLLRRLQGTKLLPGWRYVEPEASEISLPPGGTIGEVPLGAGALRNLDDRLLGAWLGRCAGCLLGKPIEGWPAAEIRDFLTTEATWPPTDYLPALQPWPGRYPAPKPSWPTATRGRIRGMPRDDDIDYTILGLHVLETHGPAFTTDDVAAELLDHLPFGQVFTAERVAYANLVAGLRPPEVARHRNPYREWIGALIRADAYGYASPGAPARAASMALRDARLTHDGNGVYAAMWAAATIAAAFTEASPRAALEAGLAFVPAGSRLHEAILLTLRLHDDGLSWDEAYSQLQERFGGYHWVHSINNAAAIAAAVLWGDGDVGRTIGLAVAAGWDTDSAGATAGSIAGALAGAQAIDPHWIEPLEDRLASSIAGFDGVAISELARRTLAVARSPRSMVLA